MYYALMPSFIGRDRFIEIMMEAGFRLKRSRNYRRTTFAGRIRYPNLIKGMKVEDSSVIWQSDITYLPLGDKFYYAIFIIDVYSKKIVGYKVSKHMRAMANVGALAMALRTHRSPKINHSDRGSQYCSSEYVGTLRKHNVEISMTQENHCYENAVAERVNGILKDEFYLDQCFANLQLTSKAVENAINIYNNKRLHLSLDYKTPNEVFKNVTNINLKSVAVF